MSTGVNDKQVGLKKSLILVWSQLWFITVYLTLVWFTELLLLHVQWYLILNEPFYSADDPSLFTDYYTDLKTFIESCLDAHKVSTCILMFYIS